MLCRMASVIIVGAMHDSYDEMIGCKYIMILLNRICEAVVLSGGSDWVDFNPPPIEKN